MYDMANVESSPPIVLSIWDKDTGVLESDDYLGRAVIRLDEAATNLSDESDSRDEETKLNDIPPPKWHDIKYGFEENTPATG